MQRRIGQGLRRATETAAVLLAMSATLLCASIADAAEFRSTSEAATVWYDAPSTKSKRVYVLGAGYPVEILVTLEGWIKVRDAAGSIGWVEARSLSPKRMLVVRPEVAQVRTAPEASAPVAYRVGRNVLLEWVESLPGGWVRVQHGASGAGFVRSADVFGA